MKYLENFEDLRVDEARKSGSLSNNTYRKIKKEIHKNSGLTLDKTELEPVHIGLKGIGSFIHDLYVYHTSYREIKDLQSDSPMWLCPQFSIAKDYHKLYVSDYKYKGTQTYQMKLSGKILTRQEAQQFAQMNNVNFERIESKLSEGTTPSKIRGLNMFAAVCDGFYFMDKHPLNNEEQTESLFVFNPAKNLILYKKVL